MRNFAIFPEIDGSPEATITVASGTVFNDRGVQNLKTADESETMRFDTTSDLVLDITLGAVGSEEVAREWGGIVLRNLANCSRGFQFRVQRTASSFDTGFLTPFPQTIDWPKARLARTAMWIRDDADAAVTALQDFRLTLRDTGNADGYLDVGNLGFGAVYFFPKNPVWGARRNVAERSRSSVQASSQSRSSKSSIVTRAWDLRVPNMTYAQVEDFANKIESIIGTSTPVCMVPEPDEFDRYYYHAVSGFLGPVSGQWQQVDRNQRVFSFVEDRV